MSTARIRTVVTALFVFVLAMWFVLPATANATSGTMHHDPQRGLAENHFGSIAVDGRQRYSQLRWLQRDWPARFRCSKTGSSWTTTPVSR